MHSHFTGQVTNKTSLFTYDDVNTYEFYNNASIQPTKFISDLNKTELQNYVSTHCIGVNINVTEVCQDNIECLVDTVATCDKAFGEKTLRTKENADSEGAILGIRLAI